MRGRDIDNMAALRRACLKTVNYLRRRHGVKALEYAGEADLGAQNWAKVMARLGKSCQSPEVGKEFGEAIAMKSRARNNLTGWEIITMWYAEGIDYKYGVETANEINKNFTQLIWASTREFSIGLKFNKKGDAYIVAYFKPVGNVDGLFRFNVFPPCELYCSLKPNLEEMNVVGLIAHNKCRRRHGMPPLVLCHDLIASAQAWAENIAPSKGTVFYSNTCSIGESIACYFDPLKFICSREVTEAWYMLRRTYDFMNEVIPSRSNVFTQMIWKSTTDVGFGRATFEGYHYLVVHYRPPGNGSKVLENVFKELDCHERC